MSGDRHKGPPHRTLRGITDDLWHAAQRKAWDQGKPLSAVIAELLDRWVNNGRNDDGS